MSPVSGDPYSTFEMTSGYSPFGLFQAYENVALESLDSLGQSSYIDYPVYKNPFGYYVGCTQRRQSTVDSLVDKSDALVSFSDSGSLVECKWLYVNKLSSTMSWHPLWNSSEFHKRVKASSLYPFQKSPGLEEPIVLTFLDRESLPGYSELKLSVLGLHRPGVTFKSVMVDAMKFAKSEPTIDVRSIYWRDAISAVRLLFDFNVGTRRLSSIQEIIEACDPTTSPGFPSNLSTFDKRGALLSLSNETLLSYLKGRRSSKTSFFCCFVRTQVQSRMKNKNRVILATDSFDQFALMHMMLDFMTKFKQLAYEMEWPFTVGDSVFYGGPDIQVSKLYGNDGFTRLGDSSDVSAWDGSLPSVVMKLTSFVCLEYVNLSPVIPCTSQSLLRDVYSNLIDSICNGLCVFPWGEILMTDKGMKSGTFVTALFNSVSHYLIRAAGFFKRYHELSAYDLKTLEGEYGTSDRFHLWSLVRMSISGDDNRSATPVLMRRFWPPSVYVKFYNSIGMVVKDSSTKDSDFIYDLWSLPYNSRIYPRVLGKFVVYRPAHILWASVTYPEREAKGAMAGPRHDARLLARCTATYLEGFMNIFFRESMELFVMKVIPPDTIIDWNVERGFRKRLVRLGIRGDLPKTFPSRRFAWNLHMPGVTSGDGERFPGVDGSNVYPCKYDALFD